MQELSDSFEHMVLRIQELMTTVREEEINLRKTELKAVSYTHLDVYKRQMRCSSCWKFTVLRRAARGRNRPPSVLPKKSR